MQPGKAFIPHKVVIDSVNGSLVVVGSHVPKTTSQLNWLLEKGNYRPLEIKVGELLKDDNAIENASILSEQVDQLISTGNNVVIYTSRRLEARHDMESNLKINSTVSGFLVSIMKGLTARPKFIVAKGGITSSDIASKGLLAGKALVLGAVNTRRPVWQMDAKSKFPGILYVVFPRQCGR
jgi:uncharacterized protein YgbK (DUF1537 family)